MTILFGSGLMLRRELDACPSGLIKTVFLDSIGYLEPNPDIHRGQRYSFFKLRIHCLRINGVFYLLWKKV